MIKRTCLLIDDEKQDDNFPIIEKEARKYRIDVTCLQFNIGNQERRDLLNNEQIDIDKVVSVFRKEFKSINIDLIAFDWNLGSSIKGPMIIKAFNEHNIRRRVPKLLYSAALRDEVEKLCNTYRNNKSTSFRTIWSQLEPLISSRALVFVSREDYEIGIVEELRNIEETLESSIEYQLRKFPEFLFKHSFVNPHLTRKTFSQILDLLENDRVLANEFIKEISEQVLSYLTEEL